MTSTSSRARGSTDWTRNRARSFEHRKFFVVSRFWWIIRWVYTWHNFKRIFSLPVLTRSTLFSSYSCRWYVTCSKIYDRENYHRNVLFTVSGLTAFPKRSSASFASLAAPQCGLYFIFLGFHLLSWSANCLFGVGHDLFVCFCFFLIIFYAVFNSKSKHCLFLISSFRNY